MAKYIECEAALRCVQRQRGPCRSPAQNQMLDFLKAAIEHIPAADVAPVVHGRWIHSRYEDCCDQFELVKCSQCNHEAYAIAFYVRDGNYCPNCGAKMDGGDSDALNRR